MYSSGDQWSPPLRIDTAKDQVLNFLRQRKVSPFSGCQTPVPLKPQKNSTEGLERNGRKHLVFWAPAPGYTPSQSFLLTVGTHEQNGSESRGARRKAEPSIPQLPQGKKGHCFCSPRTTSQVQKKVKQKKSESQRSFSKQESSSSEKAYTISNPAFYSL